MNAWWMGLATGAKQKMFPLLSEEELRKNYSTILERCTKMEQGDYQFLNHNIQPLRPNIPLALGFVIKKVSTEFVRNLAREVGSQRFTDLFEEHAEIINYSVQHEPIMCKVMGDKNENDVIVPVTAEIANERLGQLRYNLRVQVESYVISNQTAMEAEMKTKGLGETSREDFSVLTDWKNTKWNKIGHELRNNSEWPESFLDQIPKPSETNENGKSLPDSVVRAAFKKYTEDLAAAKKKVEAGVLQSIKEEMPGELYDAYMTTIGRIPIWERTMMATYLMNYWGMDHCVRPNNKKPDKKKHHTGAVVSRFLVSPNGDAAKKALLKVGQCRDSNKQAGAQVGDQQKGAETAGDAHDKDQRMGLSVSLETDVFHLWSEYPQIQMVREVQKSNNMTLTPVVPMAAGTGFGTGSETTMTLPASVAKSKPVEKPKG
jgi:hypothetical protein